MALTDTLSEQPVRTAVISVLTAGLALLIAFGVAFTTVQVGAIVAFAVAVLGVFEVVRGKVTPLSNPKTAEGVPLIEPPVSGVDLPGVDDAGE